MKSFTIVTAAGTVYQVSPMADQPNAYEVSLAEDSTLFFLGSTGTWSTGDFAPPFSDFNVAEIGKLIEFELKS